MTTHVMICHVMVGLRKGAATDLEAYTVLFLPFSTSRSTPSHVFLSFSTTLSDVLRRIQSKSQPGHRFAR